MNLDFSNRIKHKISLNDFSEPFQLREKKMSCGKFKKKIAAVIAKGNLV